MLPIGTKKDFREYMVYCAGILNDTKLMENIAFLEVETGVNISSGRPSIDGYLERYIKTKF